ncbi:TetR-like C-terminal domain-containing protein [Actinacidiphila bryophytorum]|uniref:TetR-like C-terminal domain-containing protein n=1 Tax=Actinacidiphila bryophytorum TaxID=1436133 RepID=UPI002176EB5C|nr:TetR-like C-terminal domain-containing protein [Actinacidiphila bryophytorum]UWE09951.1 WHG domain-containing protein [Actinacidiphila bryophytorum]
MRLSGQPSAAAPQHVWASPRSPRHGSAPPEALGRAAEPVLRACARLAGEADALDAARLVTAWATGFIGMELAGGFRLGGDVDRSFEYGLARMRRALGSA